jgi:hypothetical protein
MWIGWIVLALLATGQSVAAADVTVCFTAKGTALTDGATRLMTSTFRKAGVAVVWQCPEPRAPGVPLTCLPIELVEGTPDDSHPGVLAVSYPYARCSKSVTIFYDRIRALANGPHRESALLAYVLMHEITHVIQGVNRHSPTGVMKAHWSQADRTAIFERRLGFEAWDVQLMRNGLAAGWCGNAAGVTSRSERGTGFHQE